MPKKILTPIPFKEPTERKKKLCDTEVIVKPKRKKRKKRKLQAIVRAKVYKQRKRKPILRKTAHGMYVVNRRIKLRWARARKLQPEAYLKVAVIPVQPTYYFRPFPRDFDDVFYRYDDGEWIPDDGKPGLAFAGVRPDRGKLLGSAYPYCLFAKVKSQQPFKLLNQDGMCSLAEHPNYKAWQSAMQFLRDKYKIANEKNVLLGKKYIDFLDVQPAPLEVIIQSNKELFRKFLKSSHDSPIVCQ